MPFLLPAAATAIAAAAPAAAAATAATAATSIASTIATVALNAATSMAISAVMSALQPQVGAAGRVSEWTLDPDGPIPFAAGRIGVSGSAVHRKTFGPDLMYLGIASVLSGAGPIDGYEGCLADDEAVAFDGAGKAVTSQYANELWVKQTLGTQPDTALPLPAGLKAGGTTFGFGAGHKLSGMAADLVVMGENSKGTAYPTGEVKRLRILRGLKGWDPRLDSTYPGGAGACRLDNPATWVYLTNPILWALKWSLGLWSGPVGKGAPQVDCQVGGIGAKLSGIDVPAFVAAANVADANGWTVAAYPTTDDDKAQVLDAFLQAGGAIYAERAGKISCIQRAAPRTSIVTITAADTEGPIQIDMAASRIDRINTIRPRFWSEAHRWQLTALPEVTEPTWRVEDGGTRPRGIDYPYVTNATQAAQLAALQIANSREGIAGVIPLKPYMQRIRPGDAFTITEPGFVLNGVKCLCLNTAYDPATGVVSVTFVSETDAKYPYALGQSPEVPEPAVLTPIDHTVSPPTVAEWALVATVFVDGGVSIPALLLTGAVDNARAQSVIFEYRPVGAPTWAFAGAEDPTIVRKEIATITAGTDYEVAISYRIGGLISDRLVLGPVTAGALVAGDVSPITPANVAGVPTIAVATLIAPDGTQISRLSGTWVAAADALSYIVELDNGTVVVQLPATSNAISQIVPTGPTYRYRVKALSRTGTPSAAWSAWSANGAASGDVTAPGVLMTDYCQAGPKFIALGWVNPTDDDFADVVLYRNTINDSATALLLHVTSANWFTDSKVVPGTTYYYWGVTRDRSGNGVTRTALGAATARYINLGGGDIAATDPDLVTPFGYSAGFYGQTRFATATTLSLADSDIAAPFSSLESVPTRLSPSPFGDYLDAANVLFGDSFSVQQLKPAEVGSNVTETRTAAAVTGQTRFATAATLSLADTDISAPFSSLESVPTRLNPSPFGDYLDAANVLFGDSFSVQQLKPAEVGSNVTETRTAAAVTGQTRFATAATLSLADTDISAPFAALESVPSRLDASPFGDYLDAAKMLYSNSFSIQQLKPAEVGSNVTETRTSSGFTGQTGWATLTRAVASISKIDDAGRIIDGQALPLNGMSKSSTLNPAYPFSAGATPSTQINVAAVTATFAGGTTLSIGSATISGLTASTYYSIFRDLVANAYVAVSGSTTAYFTSAQRYLYIGTQATQEVGGGYEPLPPPPPGSGGGYGDIPFYVEP